MLAASVVLAGSQVSAQENLDAGKPAPRLFAEGCAGCHRSAKGLAKGRFSFTLYLFLQKHYASNATSAWALTSYLEQVDAERRGVKRTAATAPRPAARPSSPSATSSSTWTPHSPLRPPAPVPGR